jgi:anaerobic selenocysteine-containing dehydrogenase
MSSPTGHLPKGSTLKQLEADPDRLRAPQIRTDDGWRDATWEEAFTLIEERLAPIISEHGNNAVGVYLGNPNVHGWGHDREGMATSVATSKPGVNSSILSDENDLDPLSGNAISTPSP